MKRVLNLFSLILCNALLIGVGWVAGSYWTKLQYVEKEPLESHQLCYDTDVYEAWVAHKNGEMRCFMEWRSYPHRIKGSYIDETPN